MCSIRKITLVCGLLSVLAACGGGGGAGDVVESTRPESQVTVPAATAMANFVNQTKSSQMTMNGSLTAGGQSFTLTGSGTLTETSGSAIFEGQSALRKNSEMRGTLVANGEPASFSSSGQLYFDTNYRPLGSTGDGVYCVVAHAIAFPASAKAGDGGPWYEEKCYADSSKTVSIGANRVNCAIEADTATSLLLKVMHRSADPSGAILSGTSTFRVEPSGPDLQGRLSLQDRLWRRHVHLDRHISVMIPALLMRAISPTHIQLCVTRLHCRVASDGQTGRVVSSVG